jgi:histidinol-phosphate aminotransferase
MVFLANPDNPTGTAFSRAEFEAFLAAVPKELLVIYDEAYFEFVAWSEYASGLEYFRKHPNVIALRTFSKIYGLAGVRLGYGVMDAKLAGYVQRGRMPFNLTNLAQAAGLAALDDAEHVRRTHDNNLEGRGYYEAELPRLGCTLTVSHANFVLADVHRPAHEVYEQLLRRGVIVRPSNGYPTSLRISVGTREENRRCVAALKEILT